MNLRSLNHTITQTVSLNFTQFHTILSVCNFNLLFCSSQNPAQLQSAFLLYSHVATATFTAGGKRAFFTEPVTHSAARKPSVHLLLHIADIRIITNPLKAFNKKRTSAFSVNLNS